MRRSERARQVHETVVELIVTVSQAEVRRHPEAARDADDASGIAVSSTLTRWVSSIAPLQEDISRSLTV